jgi:hypothetical protein
LEPDPKHNFEIPFSAGLAVKFDSEFLIDDLHVRRSTARPWRYNPAQAETHFAQGARILASIPARLELARTHVDVAVLANLQKDANLACAHYLDAIRIFTTLNLKGHAEHTKDLAAESGVTLPE